MTTFFNVDVETSATDPWRGYLLTVGIQPVTYDPETLKAELHPSQFYVRINRSEELFAQSDAVINRLWGDPDNEKSSYGWWIEQNDIAQDEAWRDHTLVRHTEVTAARMITEYVTSVEPEQRERIFVANPVSFDKMWLSELFAVNDLEDPFHYQSLCLRSMKFGVRKFSPWGGARDNHEPKVPHHALHDAVAQAHDLIAMLAERDAF